MVVFICCSMGEVGVILVLKGCRCWLLMVVMILCIYICVLV